MRYMAALKDEAFVQKQLERSIRLFEDSTHSTDTETREAAFYTLSGPVYDEWRSRSCAWTP